MDLLLPRPDSWASWQVCSTVTPPIPFQPTVPLASPLAPNERPLKHLSGSFPSAALLFGGAKHKCRVDCAAPHPTTSPWPWHWDQCQARMRPWQVSRDAQPSHGSITVTINAAAAHGTLSVTLLWNSGLFTLREAIVIRSTTCMALPDDTSPVLSYLPIYGTQADENSASFLQTMTSVSSPVSHSHEGCSWQFLHRDLSALAGRGSYQRALFLVYSWSDEEEKVKEE